MFVSSNLIQIKNDDLELVQKVNSNIRGGGKKSKKKSSNEESMELELNLISTY